MTNNTVGLPVKLRKMTSVLLCNQPEECNYEIITIHSLRRGLANKILEETN